MVAPLLPFALRKTCLKVRSDQSITGAAERSHQPLTRISSALPSKRSQWTEEISPLQRPFATTFLPPHLARVIVRSAEAPGVVPVGASLLCAGGVVSSFSPGPSSPAPAVTRRLAHENAKSAPNSAASIFRHIGRAK